MLSMLPAVGISTLLQLVDLRMMAVLPLRWTLYGSCPDRLSLRLDKQAGRVGRACLGEADDFGDTALGMSAWMGMWGCVLGAFCGRAKHCVFVGILTFMGDVFAGVGVEDGYILLLQEVGRTWAAVIVE